MKRQHNAADDTHTGSPSRSPTPVPWPAKKTEYGSVQSPYTDYDKQNGVEKSAVSWSASGKTGMIRAGRFRGAVHDRQQARRIYDTYGVGTPYPDAGDYYFTAATDAHNAQSNNILAAKGGYTVREHQRQDDCRAATPT